MVLTAKEEAVRIISKQPDDSSYDDIIRELVLLREIEKGLDDSKQGKTISHSALKQEVNSWFTK